MRLKLKQMKLIRISTFEKESRDKHCILENETRSGLPHGEWTYDCAMTFARKRVVTIDSYDNHTSIRISEGIQERKDRYFVRLDLKNELSSDPIRSWQNPTAREDFEISTLWDRSRIVTVF